MAFALAHPWMVFWLLVLAIFAIDNILTSWSPWAVKDEEDEEEKS